MEPSSDGGGDSGYLVSGDSESKCLRIGQWDFLLMVMVTVDNIHWISSQW